MRRICDSDYVHKPLSEGRRQKLREAQFKRLGHPPGHAKVYDTFVPAEVADPVRRAAYSATARAGRDAGAATAAVAARRVGKALEVPSDGRSQGVSKAYQSIDTALPRVFRG